MLDKSSVYKNLAGIKNVFFVQKPIKFQLLGLSTASMKLFKFLLWFLKPEVTLYINFIPFCNILART